MVTPWPTWMALWQNVRRSVPYMLRKTETVDGPVALGVIRKTGITSLNFWPPVSDGSIHMPPCDNWIGEG